jgi:hypothetical protein
MLIFITGTSRALHTNLNHDEQLKPQTEWSVQLDQCYSIFINAGSNHHTYQWHEDTASLFLISGKVSFMI